MNTNISNIFLEQLSWLYAIFFSLSKTKKENRKWDKIKKKKAQSQISYYTSPWKNIC